MPLPELECPRLRLRAFQESDIRELHHLWINPEVRKYLWDDQLISRELAEETAQANLLSALLGTRLGDGSFPSDYRVAVRDT